MKKLRNDCILILGILLIAGVLFGVQHIVREGDPAIVQIYQDGMLIGEYDLLEMQTIPVFYGEDGYNLIQIADGQVYVTDADCPDQLCRKQRSVSRNGESIICLPHKLVIQICSDTFSDTDAVTY